jgi:hypothetical protein
MAATADRPGITIIFIPYTVSGAVTTGGAAKPPTVLTEPDGTRRAMIRVTGKGGYTVSLG